MPAEGDRLEHVVTLEHVSRSFGRTVAADEVSFDVRAGEVFALLGHNGAGKTTLIRMINGLLAPDAGVIRTFGHDPVAAGRDVRRRTGVLTTYPGLDDYLSPRENLAVYAAIHGLATSVAAARTTSLLTRLGLDPSSSEPSRGLSAGLKQRVALARALVHEPELLLLDEPTANLDPIAARDVRELVRGLATEGRTVVFSSHNLAEAESLADRVAILRNGRLLAVGSRTELALGRIQPGLEIHVEANQQDRATQALDALGLPVRVRSSGRLHVGDLDSSEASTVLRALVRADIDVRAAIPTTPSLEDVYMAVHERVEQR